MKRIFLVGALLLGLLGLAGGANACNVPNPNLLAGDGVHSFVDNCPLPAAALNRLVTGPQLAPLGVQAANNAALKALTGNVVGAEVYRLGFAAAGDIGGAKYVFSASSCSLNAGAGDNGSQVQPTAGGGCWLADFGGNPAPVQVWGAKCDNATDDGAAFNAAAASYSRIVVPAGLTCKIVTPVVFTSYPISLVGQTSWPTTAGQPTTIKCTTGTSDCISTLLTTTQKANVQVSNLVLDGSSQTGGNALHISNTTSSNFSKLTLSNVWNGIELDGPNDNLNTFDNLVVQNCRGSQAVLWANGSMANNSNVLTISDSVINCGSASNGIVMDGNLQTLRLAKVGIIDSGIEFQMRNTLGSTVCPGYVFISDIEFNGGPHTANFIKADCGYSLQMTNGWSFGATTGDGFAFNLNTATGNNVVMISNSELFGATIGGRCMFVNWNNATISNTQLGGCTGDVLQVGANALRTVVTGGIIANGSGYCVSSAVGATSRSLYLPSAVVAGGCVSGNFNDPAEAIVPQGVTGAPTLSAISAISGCGSGCTVAGSTGNEMGGTILMTSGTAPSSSGQFTINFPLHLTPAPLCFVTPQAGGAGVWNPLATIIVQPNSTASTTVFWNNNSVNLTASVGYGIAFKCSGLS